MNTEMRVKCCPECETENVKFGLIYSEMTFMCSVCRFKLKVQK